MDRKSHPRNPSNDSGLQLALQEPLQRELKREAEVKRDQPNRHQPRLLRHRDGLTHQLQQRRGEHENRQHEDRREEEDEPGALQVNAQHAVVSGAVGLAAEGFERARHSQRDTECDRDEDGAGDRDGGEVEVSEVAGERLGDDGDGEHGEAGEDGGCGDVAEFLGFGTCSLEERGLWRR